MKRCRNCGNITTEDATYCSLCGYKLDENNEVCYYCNNQQKKSGGFLKTIVIIFIIIVGFLAIRSCVTGKSSDGITNSVTERALTSSDYSVSTSEGVTSVTVTITAKRDIKQCNVSINLYDSDGNVIYSDTITKTNLLKDNSYSYKFDYGFVNALSGSKYSIQITGKVSLI